MVVALEADTEPAFIEKMDDRFTEDSDSVEEELIDMEKVESAGGRKMMAPPPYTDLSEFFGPVHSVGWK